MLDVESLVLIFVLFFCFDFFVLFFGFVGMVAVVGLCLDDNDGVKVVLLLYLL